MAHLLYIVNVKISTPPSVAVPKEIKESREQRDLYPIKPKILVLMATAVFSGFTFKANNYPPTSSIMYT